MIEPHVHVAWAPYGAGVLCAAFWFAQGRHVYGWFTGACGATYPASFFALEDYYASEETVFYRSAQDDVHGPWIIVTDEGEVAVAQAPVPGELCVELERAQDAFVREWLFYRDDASHADDAAELRGRGVPLREVNVRPRKLAKLQPGADAETYTSAGADLNVIVYLSARWPLDYVLR